MKKILLAFDGEHFSEGALRFAGKLNAKEPVFITGAFLPQIDLASLWSYAGGNVPGASYIPLVEDESAEHIKNNIKRFESFCRTNKIRHRVHKDYFDFALPELKKESRYADLLIISSEIFYEQAGTDEPNEYLKQALHGVECPVIIVPENCDLPQSNILSYDGSESSVIAIKQFALLFPEMARHPTILVYAREKDDREFPSQQNIKELITAHYPQTTWLDLEKGSRKNFTTWMSEQKGACLVSGAYGRGGLSMMFRKSFITDIIAEHRVPVFVAHK